MLEYRDAVNSDSRYGYMLYLERHPDSVFVLEVKRRLEDLDYRKACEENTIESLRSYLTTWPNGQNEAKARKDLDRKICERWLDCPEPKDLLRFLKANPDLSCVNELNARVEQLRFDRASNSSGARVLTEFIELYPKGKLTPVAEKILIERNVRALIKAARFERALQIIQGESCQGECDFLKRSVSESRDEWIAASFDPARIRAYLKKTGKEESKQLEKWALELERSRDKYIGFARDVSFLTQGSVQRSESDRDSFAGDPRNRVLWMRSLAFDPDESNLDKLMDGLMDSFEGVRVYALDSLLTMAESLGDVRTEAWAMARIKNLKATASTGSLLAKLAVLHLLSGDRRRALVLLERDLTASAVPDPFMLYLAGEICVELGENEMATILASRLSDEVHRRCRQRIDAWTADKVVKDGEQGWIILRRVHGLLLLWDRTMARFHPNPSGSEHAPGFDEIAGPWREKSHKYLEETRTWFNTEEKKWSTKHPEYEPCQQAWKGPTESGSVTLEQEAVFRLAIAGNHHATPVLQWSACCHPRKRTRAFATLILYQQEWIRLISNLWQVADLGG